MFRRHRHPKRESGIVDAMESGKVSLPPDLGQGENNQEGEME
jgi:hypothetical protein